MLLGSIIQGDDSVGGMFSDLCLRRMDGDQGRWESELQVVAMVLLGGGVARSRYRNAVAVEDQGCCGSSRSGWACPQTQVYPLDAVVEQRVGWVVALVVISAWQPEVRRRGVLRLTVVLWGVTAFGAIHTIVEYVVMTSFSEADWDAPPGTGYLTVATITISAILTVIMTLRTPKRAADDDLCVGGWVGADEVS
jgi:hypothetical protein